MPSYRKAKLAPTLLVVLIGGSCLAAIIWNLGTGIFSQWYFYPSIVFWIFSAICLVSGRPETWHHSIWRCCQIWSALWSIVFVLSFCAPPFSTMIIGALIAPIAISAGVNPFLAAFAHILIWAAVTDILKTPKELEQW